MNGEMAIALLEIGMAMTAFFAVVGIYEYVLCPMWDKWKEKK